MQRALTDLPWLIGALILGMLLGSWLGATSLLWWLVIALAVVAIAAGIAGRVYRSRKASNTV